MYSSEDLERFYFQYQTEALPHGESLQSFCLKNKVPYNIFEKWYKDTRLASPSSSSSGSVPPVRIWIDLRMSNGLHLSQKNLSYQDLVRMIGKLEGLC